MEKRENPVNVVAICADTFRADYLDNDRIETPNLDSLASSGVVFEQAYAEGLPTLPARRVYFTGRRLFPRWEILPHKGDHLSFQPAWHAIPEEEVTIAEMLSEAGVTCGFITDVYHYFKPTGNFHRGFQSWQFIRGQEADAYRTGPMSAIASRSGDMTSDFELSSLPPGRRQYLLNVSERPREEDYLAPKVMRTAVRWIEDNVCNQPFFLWVDCFDPHEPWDPPLHYADRYYSGPRDPSLIFAPSVRAEDFSKEEMTCIEALYAGEVTMVDAWIGNLLRRLDDLGLADKTAVLFTSDHGTLLGELGTIHKQPWGLVQPQTRLPLIMRLPRSQMAGRRVAQYVSSLDVAPTILALLGQRPPEVMDGQNLVDIAEDKERGREFVISAYGPYASIRTPTHNYIAPYRDMTNTPWAKDPQRPRLFALDENLREERETTKEQQSTASDLHARLMEEASCAERG